MLCGREDALTLEAYLRNPCAALSIPYYKALRIKETGGLRIVHESEFDGLLLPGETDTRYFRLYHALKAIDAPIVASGYRLQRVTARDAQAVSALFREAFPGMDATPQYVRGQMTDAFSFAPGCMGAWTDSGRLAGVCLCTFDASACEGVVDYLAVRPDCRKRGLATALVNACLLSMRGSASFATVSGQVDNPTHPLGVYRQCGFTGEDVWHIIASASRE